MPRYADSEEPIFLNYIDFFLEEHRDLGMLDDPCTVDNAPSSIYGYYTEQLKKYFTEAGKLGFYKEQVKPLILSQRTRRALCSV